MADEMFDMNTIPRVTYRRFKVSFTKNSRINPIISIIPMKIELLMFYLHALVHRLSLTFIKKRLAPALMSTFGLPYERQMRKVSNFRNLFCIVPLPSLISFKACTLSCSNMPCIPCTGREKIDQSKSN